MFPTVSHIKSKTKVALILMGSKAFDWFPGFYFPSPSEPLKKDANHYCIFYISSLGSLGDAAMGYSIITQIREKNPQARITILIHKDADRSYFDQYGVEIVSIQGYFSIIPEKSATRRIAKVLETCSHFIIPGADVLDGVYSRGGAFRRLFSGMMAERMGAKVHVVGFSFSDRAPLKQKELFREKCQNFNIVCRDPMSAERLSKAMGREIPNGADLAFLLPVGEKCLHPAAQAAEDIVTKWHAENRPVVVFNANPLSFKNALSDVPLSKVAAALSHSLDEFCARTGAAILFLTHDNRKAHSDAQFSTEIIDGLQTDFPRHFVPQTVQPTDIKRLCQLSDLVVTGRMHLGIAGLGAGRTTMITDYQGKVRGLYAMFATPELALDLGEIIQETRLADLMEEAFRKRSSYELQIQASLPSLKTLSRKNLLSLWD